MSRSNGSRTASPTSAYNCIDRHLEKRGEQTAIIWEGDDPYYDKKITYRELHEHVCRLANVLKKHGVKKGDRVTIYMPMIPEAAYAMLAVRPDRRDPFGGVRRLLARSPGRPHRGLRTRNSSSPRMRACAAGKRVPLKANTDEALERAGSKVTRSWSCGAPAASRHGMPARDLWYHDEMAQVIARLPPTEKMKAEDPLFILYTSGSTGKPKGVLHTTGGYLVYASMTHRICLRLS